MDTRPPNSFQPHRSYWPVVTALGIVPYLILLSFAIPILLIAGNTIVNYGFIEGGWAAAPLAWLFLFAPAINLLALLSKRPQFRPRMWVALFASGGLALWGVYVSILEPGGMMRYQADFVLAYVPALIGLSTLAAIAWSRLACGPQLRITLGQLAGGTAFGCLLLAAAKWILDYMAAA